MTHVRPVPSLVVALAALLLSPFALSQSTQVVISTDANTSAKTALPLSASQLTLKVAGHSTPIQSLDPLAPDDTQVALLIDDGLRTSVGRQLPDLQHFLSSLPAGVEVLVGYMQNGRVVVQQPFTSDHAGAASSLRLPLSAAGLSASPYLCLSDFAKQWPRETEPYGSPRREAAGRKHRLVMMLTSGVDPYNGSVSPLNQDSPYVQTAIRDAQRAGISVSSIYYGDSGIHGGLASLSGQSYLQQIAQATGGVSYYNMRGNPVSLTPYLDKFVLAIRNSYVAAFDVPPGKDLVTVRFSAHTRGVKLHVTDAVQPGSQAGSSNEGR